MALTDAQLAAIRQEIGATSPPDDDDLSDRFDRIGTTNGVVVEILRGRLADYLAGPTTVSIPGIYSESHGDSVKGLQSQIASLESGTDGKLGTGRLFRRGRSRSECSPRRTPF